MRASRAPEGGVLREWLRFVSDRFAAARLVFGHGTHNARDEALWLLMHVLKLPYERIDDSLERPLTAIERRRALRLMEARIATRKPLAYLLREAWLLDRRFYVDERVIVPRSFIAELLPEALEHWGARKRRVRRVLDMCTGSACLAILAAQAYPEATVTGADISRAALAVARKNVALHRGGRRVKLLRSDLFSNIELQPFDLILANPPYVTSRDMRRLPAEYRHEPQIALAGGTDGLEAVDILLREAPRYLKPKGLLIVEIGHNRRALERKYPTLPFSWPSTSAGDDMVFLLTREELLNKAGERSAQRDLRTHKRPKRRRPSQDSRRKSP